MSWLNNILSFFKELKQEQVELENIDLNQLGSWLKKQEEEIIIKNSLKEVIDNYVRILKAKRWEFECQLDQWEELFPPEKKLNYKEIIIETRNLLNLIVFIESDLVLCTLNLNTILDERTDKVMRMVEDSTFSNDYSYMLTEKEKNSPNTNINPILQELLNLDGLRSEFEKKIVRSGIRVLEKLNSKNQSIINCNEKINQLNKEIRSKRERLDNNAIKKKEKENFIDELKNNSDYKNLINNNEAHKKTELELDKKNEEIIIYFSKLQQILKNYQQFNVTGNYVNEYLVDSLKAFLNDEGLSIIHALDHLRAIIISGKLDLDPQLIKSSLILLEKEKVNNLRQLQLHIINLNKKLNESNQEHENKDFLEKLEDANYRLQHFRDQEKQLNNQINNLEEDFNETIEIRSREKKMFQNIVKIGLNKEILIKLPS